MKKPIYKRWWFWVLAVCIVIGGVISQFEEEETAKKNEQTDKSTTQSASIGSSKNNPYVLTVTELVKEIETDINTAKAKYNGKWVKITGEITDTSSGGGIYGYYLYGKRITTGYSGLRIICWCDNGPYSGSVLGDTQTFLGQIREITTFNATEIGDCEIVK